MGATEIGMGVGCHKNSCIMQYMMHRCGKGIRSATNWPKFQINTKGECSLKCPQCSCEHAHSAKKSVHTIIIIIMPFNNSATFQIRTI